MKPLMPWLLPFMPDGLAAAREQRGDDTEQAWMRGERDFPEGRQLHDLLLPMNQAKQSTNIALSCIHPVY